LDNISPADAGNYTLCVTNDYGSIESTDAVLTVIASVAPVITRQPRSLEVAEGVNTWMSVAATGTPDPWYFWTKEGTPPPPPPGPFSPPLIISSYPQRLFYNVTTNDAGIYFAIVTNYAGGGASQDALLTVLPAITNVGSWNQDAEDIFVTNGVAFLARGTNGLAILNVSNPASPQLLGSCGTPGYASAVRVSGGFAFIADGSGLEIISVINPANPTLVGSYETPGDASDVAVRSNLVYLAEGNAGLLILNVSNSVSPSPVGSYSTNFYAVHICLSGNLAYLTSFGSAIGIGSNNWVDGMLILDVSNPAKPTQVAHWGGSAGTVAAHDQLLFAGTSVISVTNPSQPTVIGYLDYDFTNNPFAYLFSANDLQVVNDLLYVASSFDGQMQLFAFDVRDPSEPIPVGYYTAEGNGTAFWVNGNYVYIVGYDSPLEIIKTPFDPSPIMTPTLSVSAGVRLRIQGQRGRHYNVEYTDQLIGAQWQMLQTILLTNDNAVVEVPSGPAARFFRLKQLD
jgi:hypothetical protein